MQTEPNAESTDAASDAPAPARYTELQRMIAGMAADFDKFYNHNNKAAGTRVRAAMQELKALAQTIRNEVTSIKNAEGGGTGGAAPASDD
jgi:hypothetical protein